MIITSMILILLVITSIGIVWVVVQTALEDNTDRIEIQSQCLGIDLKVSKIDCPAPNPGDNYICEVSILRKTGGGDFDGVIIVFSNEDGTKTEVYDHDSSIGKLETKKIENIDTGITLEEFLDEGKTELVPYFLASNNEKVLC